jgi:hypothetical protein
MTLLARLSVLGLAALLLAAPGGEAILEPGIEGGEIEDSLFPSTDGQHLRTVAGPAVSLAGQTPLATPISTQSWDRPPPARVPSSGGAGFSRLENGGSILWSFWDRGS